MFQAGIYCRRIDFLRDGDHRLNFAKVALRGGSEVAFRAAASEAAMLAPQFTVPWFQVHIHTYIYR